ncbi:MAG TPA: tetratricopeptide repeat protein [Tepidisphaeraceae bacterium]|nr:tetratricopeptide repeat protein [Tepidisphaeraceae bacterium]
MNRLRLVAAGGVLAVCAAGCHNPNRPAASAGNTPPAHGDVIQNPDRARANTEQAYHLIEKEKYAQAEPILKQAIELDPMYGPAHNDLGLVYFHLGRMYEAAWEFENAGTLMPKQPAPRNNLGLVLEESGELKEAQAAFEKAVELAPDNPEYLGNLARARIRLGLEDAQTLHLLQELLLRDTRPDWLDWERANLLRIRGVLERPPTTAP